MKSDANSLNSCGGGSKNKRHRRLPGLALIAALAVIPVISEGAVLLDGFGGPQGYGDLAMGRNDDGSSNLLNLPFSINFFGSAFNQFYVNNNGNLTFRAPLSTFTPNPFPVTNQPMIAPWWADVDTRPANAGAVYVASPNPNTIAVTWNKVGYYNSNTDRLNSFQVLLLNRADTGLGNFDIVFRYDQLQWTTGDVSSGIPAQAGFDAGNNRDFFTLPGSRTAAVTDLANLSNVSTGTPGLWSFQVRENALPGSTPENPLMPVVIGDQWHFDFNIGNINQRVFIDPDVAIGYDYFSDSGPLFASVLLPTGIGDGLYDLWAWNAATAAWFDTGSDITGGVPYNFAAGGVDRFRIRGIEESANINPLNVNGFVTGLTFVAPGAVSVRQVALSTAAAVPEPGTVLAGWALCAVVGMSRVRRKRN